jgi:hypothetical protein
MFSSKDVLQDVGPHLERLLPGKIRIAMHGRIFPPVAQITFMGVKNNQPSLINQPESLGGFAVVFMDFRQPVWKVKFLMIYRMVKGKFQQFEFRKDPFQLRPDELVEAVVVVDV